MADASNAAPDSAEPFAGRDSSRLGAASVGSVGINPDPPGLPETPLLRARGLLQSGRRTEALAVCQALLAGATASDDELIDAGRILMSLRQWGLAVKAFDRALARGLDYPLAHRERGLALAALGELEGARLALSKADSLFAGKDVATRNALFCFAPFWWLPLSGKRVRLLRRGAEQVDFLQRCYGDPVFVSRYQRAHPGIQPDLKGWLAASAKKSPLELCSMDWVITTPDGVPVGLAALADLDPAFRRAEFSIGFPEPPAPGLALEASLMVLAFAFKVINLNKLVALVYADNADAQANIIHLGFVQEGFLRQHVIDESGRPLDVFLNGMTRQDFESHPGLQRLLVRHGLRGKPCPDRR